MVTAVRSETQQSKTVPRPWLLHVQVRNTLCRTTDISQNRLEQIDKGLSNQWIQKISVYGLDGNRRCHVGLELTIDWQTFSLLVSVLGETLTVKQTVFREDNLAPEVQNAVAVFNRAVIEQCLKTKWSVSYPTELDRAYINRELGFSPSPPLTWAGEVDQRDYPVPELPELTVTFLEATPDEPLGVSDRIKDAFG